MTFGTLKHDICCWHTMTLEERGEGDKTYCHNDVENATIFNSLNNPPKCCEAMRNTMHMWYMDIPLCG